MRDALNAVRCTKFLKALADPERLRIVQCLQAGPLSVGEIADRLKAPIANVSHHLKQLRTAAVVTGRKQGKQVIYAMTPRVLKRPKAGVAKTLDVLDFGCCRLELGGTAGPDAGGRAKTDDPKHGDNGRSASRADAVPEVAGRWVGHWEPSGAANASVARGAGRNDITCVIQSRGEGRWHATFEGESGHAYKYAVEMTGRPEGGAVLFRGSVDLGDDNGGVFDWLGRATADQFVGYYSSARYTGAFKLRRAT